MRCFSILSVLLCLAPLSVAQEAAVEPERRTEWETDRDSFTPSVFTAGRATLILESAYSFVDNKRSKDAHSFPELLTRYGLTDRLEFRLGWNYEIGSAIGVSSGSTGTEDEAGRESSISYGFKYMLTKQRDWMPDSAMILAAYTPTSGEATSTRFVATYVAGREFENGMRLDASFRFAAESEEGDRFEEWAPSIVLKIPLGERWNTHIEYFGIMSSNKHEDLSVHYISPGLHCLVRENFEAGVRVGWGLNEQTPNFFVNAGIGLRY